MARKLITGERTVRMIFLKKHRKVGSSGPGEMLALSTRTNSFSTETEEKAGQVDTNAHRLIRVVALNGSPHHTSKPLKINFPFDMKERWVMILFCHQYPLL